MLRRPKSYISFMWPIECIFNPSAIDQANSIKRFNENQRLLITNRFCEIIFEKDFS
jgi:hypothetical protein